MKSNSLLVTIAIPIYNAEKYLDYAIISVINQTFDSWELLLMEDGSSDNSPQIAQAYAEKDKRIKVISDGQNKGLIARLNQSVSLANGKYYARMDADDIMVITRIEQQVTFLEAHTNVDVIGSSTMLIDGDNQIIGSRSMKDNYTSFIHPSVMGKTEWFKANLYSFDAYRVEDKDLWYRTSHKSTFYNLEQPLMFYRAFGSSTSVQTFKSNQRQRKLFKKYKQYEKSLIWCVKNTLMSYVKDVVFFIMPLLGGDKFFGFIRKRHPVPAELHLTNEDLLKSIAHEKSID